MLHWHTSCSVFGWESEVICGSVSGDSSLVYDFAELFAMLVDNGDGGRQDCVGGLWCSHRTGRNRSLGVAICSKQAVNWIISFSKLSSNKHKSYDVSKERTVSEPMHVLLCSVHHAVPLDHQCFLIYGIMDKLLHFLLPTTSWLYFQQATVAVRLLLIIRIESVSSSFQDVKDLPPSSTIIQVILLLRLLYYYK